MSKKPSKQGPDDESDKSAMPSVIADLLMSLSGKRNKDGEPTRKRGPKPDSKPALTRRQELNRQAQRSHRERKEQYIGALETEVLRLKEMFNSASEQKEGAFDENKQLRLMLLKHGIPFPPGVLQGIEDGSGSQTTMDTSSHFQSTRSLSVQSPHSTFTASSGGQAPQQITSTKPSDYEQTGIDFVLTLERPCMAHLPEAMSRHCQEGLACGHTLMASHPPKSFQRQSETIPGLWYADEGNASGQNTWQATKADLKNLLELSRRLDLEGEITPVMAWDLIMQHPNFSDFSVADFEALTEELSSKVKCYGFGAVTEEFEVRDAIDSIVYRYQDTVMGMA